MDFVTFALLHLILKDSVALTSPLCFQSPQILFAASDMSNLVISAIIILSQQQENNLG